MSGNCESTADTIAGYFALGLILFGLLLLFPFTPGMIIGWELAEHFKLSKDISYMVVIAGAVVNYAAYELFFWLIPRCTTLQRRVLTYLLAIAALLYSNFVFENVALAKFSIYFGELIFFLADPYRWFVDNSFINGILAVFYFALMIMMYWFVKAKVQAFYKRYKQRRMLQARQQS